MRYADAIMMRWHHIQPIKTSRIGGDQMVYDTYTHFIKSNKSQCLRLTRAVDKETKSSQKYGRWWYAIGQIFTLSKGVRDLHDGKLSQLMQIQRELQQWRRQLEEQHLGPGPWANKCISFQLEHDTMFLCNGAVAVTEFFCRK